MKWISVNDALPGIGDSVLVLDDELISHIAYITNRQNLDMQWVDTGAHEYIYSNQITHWMPLPEPPEEE